MNYRPSSREKALQPVMDRLEKLIRQEQNSQATMQYLEEMLREAGMVVDVRTDDPMAFALDVRESLLELDPGAYLIPLQPLRELETAEELLAVIVPANSESR